MIQRKHLDCGNPIQELDYDNNLVPNRILFDPDPVIYNRSNWSFVYAAGDWESLIDGFVTQIVPQL